MTHVRFTEFKCVLCEGHDVTSDTSSFSGLHELVCHFADNHVQKDESSKASTLQCPICPATLRRKGTSLGSSRLLMSQALVHLTCQQYIHDILHDWPIPDYVTRMTCQHCEYVSVRPGDLRRHVESMHERQEVVCDKCGKMVLSKQLSRHKHICGRRHICQVSSIASSKKIPL